MKKDCLFKIRSRLPHIIQHSIRYKIIMMFLLSLLCYILLFSIVFWRILEQATLHQVSQGAKQSVDLLISGIDSQLANAVNISYNLLQNADIVRWLRSNSAGREGIMSRKANQVLTQTYVTFPGIESIYLFSNEGDKIYASHHLARQTFKDIRETSWHARAVDQYGGAFITLNADGTLFSSAGQNNISFIRQILDLGDFKPVGFLVINLNEDFISNTTRQIYEKYNTDFFLLDENKNPVLTGQEEPDFGDDIPAEGVARSIQGVTIFLYQARVPSLGWTIISATPYHVLSGVPYYPQLFLIPVLCAVGMYFFSFLYMTNLITKPVSGLINSMRGVREGKFEPLPPDKRQDEFGQLKDDYNIMVGALNVMIQHRVHMEKETQRYELDILGEQIKPHFLYNTLDTISYLILSGDNQSAGEAVNALSRYYQTSLSKGAETIPLDEELRMIQNYLALQKIRYGEILEDCYEITPEAGKTQVPRNILQPLVENCIYHGIKPSGEPGRVTIRAELCGDTLHVAVEDTGLGMTARQLSDLDTDIIDKNTHSFGLRGTIKRLRLFYSRDDVYEVKSEPLKGTAVLLKIPVGQEESV